MTVILIVSAVSCRHVAAPYRTMDGAVWRTTYHIIYRSDKLLDDSIIETINSVDRSLSAFNTASIVAAVNRSDTAARADRRLRDVWQASRTVWEASEGRFDPTLGPAIKLWGFGPGKLVADVNDRSIDSVRALVGFDGCRICPDGRVEKKHPRTEFNFSAIAKGYACDEVAGMLSRNGVTDYLVEIGGEIALCGKNSRGKPWRVMVDAPSASDTARHTALAFIELTQGAVASSGNYRNYRDIKGKGRVGHTILPSTCLPAPQRLLSVTVTAPTCMLADALATACMTGDSTDARRLMARFPEAACVIVADDSTVITCGNFPQF